MAKYKEGDRVIWNGRDLYVLEVWDENPKHVVYMVGVFENGPLSSGIASGIAQEDDLFPLIDITRKRMREELEKTLDQMSLLIEDYRAKKIGYSKFFKKMKGYLLKFKEIEEG
jgi:hypothetical protein